MACIGGNIVFFPSYGICCGCGVIKWNNDGKPPGFSVWSPGWGSPLRVEAFLSRVTPNYGRYASSSTTHIHVFDVWVPEPISLYPVRSSRCKYDISLSSTLWASWWYQYLFLWTCHREREGSLGWYLGAFSAFPLVNPSCCAVPHTQNVRTFNASHVRMLSKMEE